MPLYTHHVCAPGGDVEVATSCQVTIWRNGDDGDWHTAVYIDTPRLAADPGEGGGP